VLPHHAASASTVENSPATSGAFGESRPGVTECNAGNQMVSIVGSGCHGCVMRQKRASNSVRRIGYAIIVCIRTAIRRVIFVLVVDTMLVCSNNTWPAISSPINTRPSAYASLASLSKSVRSQGSIAKEGREIRLMSNTSMPIAELDLINIGIIGCRYRDQPVRHIEFQAISPGLCPAPGMA